ncbi:MAG: substrate-binding domain-containing protein [Dehalococcoidia bacterium]
MTRYREICADIAGRIIAGDLQPGDELPALRTLAELWDTTPSTASRAQRHLAEASVITLFDRRRARIAPEAAIAARRFLRTEPVFRLAGSDDPALDVITRSLSGSIVRVAGAGSFAGLHAVRQGDADGAAIHLLHHTGAYNAPFAQALLRGLHPHLVHLWRREQGLIVPPGNPANITTIQDLPALRVVKRHTGTGTRVLLDRLLITAGHNPDHIRGPEVDTHLDVGLAVATGSVDVGLGVRPAASALDLDFVPLTWEDYDLVLGGASLDAAAPLIAALRTPNVRAAITQLGGYDTANSGTPSQLADRITARSWAGV